MVLDIMLLLCYSGCWSPLFEKHHGRTSRFGRYFLISSNTTTSLTLDTSRNNGDGLTTVFLEGDTVEVVAAPTLAPLFGNISSALPTNWTAGYPGADWVYLWDYTIKPYYSYSHIGNSFEPAYSRVVQNQSHLGMEYKTTK